MATTPPTIDHASIGQITGILAPRHPNVEQYLGIEYAKLENRFARGTPSPKPSGPVHATSTGPLPVADPKNCDNEHLLLQHALPHPEFKFSDTECLTLNISAPSSKVRAEAAGPLPVIAWVHGGGFLTGSANWPQWDTAALVEHSVKIGSPVIVVGINYRLGIFGFMTSSAMRDAGFKPNNGLDDQRLALRWIQKHISGFGGDPKQVTYMGSSAGAIAGFYHLQSPEEPLFNRFAALAGNPLMTPLPSEVAEVAYGIATGALGIDKLPPAEQIRSLLDTPAEDLVAKLATVGFPLGAVLDGDLIKKTPSLELLADAEHLEDLFPGAASWSRTLMIGDAQFDGMIMGIAALAGRAGDELASTLKKSLAALFPGDGDGDGGQAKVVDAVVSGYGIDEAKDDKLPVLHFLNDIIFAQGAKATARAWARAGGRLGTKAFLTHVNMPNPWEGPYQGQASHALDAALVMGNLNEFLGDGQRACAEKMASDMLTFAYGKDPFPPYSGQEDGTSMVYYAGIDSKEDVSHAADDSQENETGRRSLLEDISGGQPAVLDKFLGAFGLLVQGPK